MIYAIVVMRNDNFEQTFADALAGVVKPRKVYVAGMAEGKALAAALNGRAILTLEDPDAETLLDFSFSERIGVEGDGGKFEDLLAVAQNRCAQLQRQSDRRPA